MLLAVFLVTAAASLSFLPSTEDGKEGQIFRAESADPHLRTIQTFTLKNGLQVVVIPNRNRRDTLHMVWYKVGSVDDPPGKSGLAHLVEHLTFGGTKNTPVAEFSRILEQAGDKQDGITARDYTVYYQIVAPEQLATFMALEADRMSNVVFSESSMASESKAVLDERQETDWRAALEQRVDTALYGDHPYGKSESTRGNELDSLEEAIAFYRERYAPNNAIVLVSGNVTTQRIMQLAEKHYGDIPSRTVPERRIPDVALPVGSRSVSMKDSRAQKSIWRKSFLAPTYTAGAIEHVYALQVLGSLLASGPGSRLHERLVREKALAQEIGVDYEPDALSLSSFSIYVVLKPQASFKEIAREVELELGNLLITAPSPGEVARAQRYTRPHAELHEEHIPGIAVMVGGALVRGRKLEGLHTWPDKILAVTPKEVQEAARAVFVPDRSVAGTLSRR